MSKRSASAVPIWLYGSILAAALLSIFSLSFRFRVEAENKATAIVVEADSIKQLAASAGITDDAALKALKAKGLGGIVAAEDVAGAMISTGHAQIQTRGHETTLTFADSDPSMQRVSEALRNRFGANVRISGPQITVSNIDPPIIRSTSIGIDFEDCNAAKRLGLLIVARYASVQGVTKSLVEKTLDAAQQCGAEYFLPSGDQVLAAGKDGFKDLPSMLKARGMSYASAEFAKIGGDQTVIESDPSAVVRLHSAQVQEIDRMSPPEIVERYSKAARERNIRLLLLRAPSVSNFQDFGTLLEDLATQLKSDGMLLGKPHPFRDSNVPSWLGILIALSTVPVVWWTLTQLVSAQLVSIGTAITILVALASVKDSFRPFAALIGALVMPTSAFILIDKREGKSWLLEFLVASAISLVGGLIVAGMLNSLPFFVRADQFSGVKLAHFAPIAVIGYYFAMKYANFKEASEGAITWSKALLSLVILVGLVLMASRTGNDNPAAVSGAELKFRGVLDTILYVRPRTKEFLVGHPFLIVGIWLLIRHKLGKPTWGGGWIALILMIGAIGETSVVNTMCHFHTPLVISLARIGVGLVSGGIIGAIAIVGVSHLQPRKGTT